MRRIRVAVTGPVLRGPLLAAVSILVAITAGTAQESPGAASARFTIPHQANDAGGGRSTSTRFEIISAIAPLGNFATTAAPVAVKSGFPGQLNEPSLVKSDQVTSIAAGPLRIPASSLLANDFDAEGDAIRFISVATVSSNGISLSVVGPAIVYDTPPGNVSDDTFTYTVFDGFDYSVGTVIVTFSQPENITLGIILSAPGPGARLQVHGVPGHTYQIQTTSDLAPPVFWTKLGPPKVAPANGLIEQLDMAPLVQRFYRAIKP